jgi:hypothetical protein
MYPPWNYRLPGEQVEAPKQLPQLFVIRSAEVKTFQFGYQSMAKGARHSIDFGLVNAVVPALSM